MAGDYGILYHDLSYVVLSVPYATPHPGHRLAFGAPSIMQLHCRLVSLNGLSSGVSCDW